MATHNDIGLSQPAASTTTHRLDAIQLDHNSTTVLREVMVVGSPETTNALSAVLAAAPASTAFGLVVRIADPIISSVAGTVVVSPVSTASVRVAQSSAADLLATVSQSTYTDLNGLMRIADRDASTAVVAVVNAVAPASTAYGQVVRMPAPFADSTNSAIRVNVVAGSVAGDTSVTVNGNTSSNSSVYLPVRLTNGTAFLSPATDYVSGSTASGLAGPTLTFDNGSNATMRAVSSTLGFPVNVVAGSAASTVVTVNGNASSNSSLYLPVRLSNGTAFLTPGTDYTDASTASNLAGPALTFDNGSNATMRIVGISQGLPVNVVAGSAASTTVNVSSLAGTVIVSPVSTASVRVAQSTAGDLQATVTPNSTAWTVLSRATTSSGGAVEGSTGTPLSGVLGLHVRQVPSTVQSTTVTVTSSNSTAVYSLISSVAGQVIKVHAYFVGCSTSGNHSTLVFMSSLAIDRWGIILSSGVFGANLAIPPPGFLFRTDNQNALNVRIESASTAIQARISLSYVQEP